MTEHLHKERFKSIRDVRRIPFLLKCSLRPYEDVSEVKCKRVSIRLSDEAAKRCEDAKKMGYTQSEFIEQAILTVPIYYDRERDQRIIGHFCEIETLIARMENGKMKEAIREELNEVCQILRSSQVSI